MQSKIFWQARSEYGWYEVRWWIANDCRLRASGLPLWAIFLDVNTSQIAQYMEGTEQWKYMVISLEDIKCSTAQGSTAQLQSGRMLVTTMRSVARPGIFLKPAPCLRTNPFEIFLLQSWMSCAGQKAFGWVYYSTETQDAERSIVDCGALMPIIAL